MRHRKHNKKLGRSGAHRSALLSALVVALIKRRSITTTVVKAKEAKQLAEKMVTLARKGTVPARRLAAARLHDDDATALLFKEIVPIFEGRNGGYTRVVKLGQRASDGSEMAILQWVEKLAADKPAEAPAEKPAEAKA